MKKNFKIYDCFMFNNENLILDIRLNVLNNYVDYFVIVESIYDHAGNKKKLNFKIEKFNNFKEKIIYIIVKKMPIKVKSFYYKKKLFHENHVRDQFQRNQILRGLKKASKNDLIIISDIDEIPNLSKIDFKKIKKCTIFFQKVYRLKLNLECKNEYPWQGSRILQYKYLKLPQIIRNTKVKRIKPWQFHRFFTNPRYITNGGWHFTSILPLNKVIKKFKSGAHGELDFNRFKVNSIKKKILKGNDIIHDNHKLTRINLDESFPDYILRNRKKFQNYIA